MIQGSAFFRLLLFATVSNAVPFPRSGREVRSPPSNSSGQPLECLSDDVVYHSGDQVPSPGPCEQCFCDPPNVICTMIKCKLNSGCKTIQRANHCCPDYKCDCEYNGRVYNNGERLDRPDDPCKVCYCKGGEVMCTSITCYEREDCKPHFIDGQCCPKYDHCPIESVHSSGNYIRSVNSTTYNSKREMQPWLLTKEISVPPSMTPQTESSTKPTSVRTEPTPAQNYPQTIKIREILPTSSLIGNPVSQREPSVGVAQTTSSPSTQGSYTNGFNKVAPSKTRITQSGITSEKNSLAPATAELAQSKKTPLLITLNPLKINSTAQESITLSNTYNINETTLKPELNLNFEEGYSTKEDRINESEHPTVSNKIENENNSNDDTVDHTTELSSDDLTSTTEPTFDLIVDIHNSTDRVRITLPTEEPFSTLQPNKDDFDSEASEIDYQGSSSTELLSGGVYTSSESGEIESTSENFTEQYGNGSMLDENNEHQNSNMLSESFYINDTSKAVIEEDNDSNYNNTQVSVEENDSSDVTFTDETTEPLKISTYQTDLPSVASLGENEASSTMAAVLIRSEESGENSDDSGAEEDKTKKVKPSRRTSDSSSESSSSEESESVDESKIRSDELFLPPILQLNEQIQYLKLGGHHEDEQTQSLIHVDIFNIHSKPVSCNSTSHESNAIEKGTHSNIELKLTENSKGLPGDVKVSHVLLSPIDLKTLAEFLISVQRKNSMNKPKSAEESSTLGNDPNEEATSSAFTTVSQSVTEEIPDNSNYFTINPDENSDLLNSTEGKVDTTESTLISNYSEENRTSFEQIMSTTPTLDFEIITSNEGENTTHHNSSEYDSDNSPEEFPTYEMTEGFFSLVPETTESSLEMADERETISDGLKNGANLNHSKPEKYIKEVRTRKRNDTIEEELLATEVTFNRSKENQTKTNSVDREYVTEQLSTTQDDRDSSIPNNVVKHLTSH